MSGTGLFGLENAATVGAFAEQTQITFPLLLKDSTYNQYAPVDGAISPYPLDVVVDKTGTIRYVRHEYDGQAIQAVIEQLLQEP